MRTEGRTAGHVQLSTFNSELLGWRRWAAPVALALLPLLVYGRFIAFGDELANADVFLAYRPVHTWLAEGLRRGVVPLWNPYIAGGFPLAFSEYGWFSPLNWLPLVLGGGHAGYYLAVACYVALAGLAVYGLARRWGATRSAGLLGGLIFSQSLFVAGGAPLLNQGAAYWTLPALLWAVDACFDGRPAAAPATAALAGLLLLGSHPQMAVLVGLPVAGYALWLAVLRRRLSPLLALATAGAAGVAIAAARFWPTLPLIEASTRSSGLSAGAAAIGSVSPAALLAGLALPSLAVPRLFTGQWSAYVGPLPLLLAAFGLRAVPRQRAILLGALAALGVVLALGSYTPVYWLVQRTPLLTYFREPSRFLLWSVLAVALLAAAGLDRARRAAPQPRRRVVLAGGLCVALLALGLGVASAGLHAFEPRLRLALQLRALAGARPRDYPVAHYAAAAGASWNQLRQSVNPLRPETLVPLLALAGAVWWWWARSSGVGFTWPAERRAVSDPATMEQSTLKGASDGLPTKSRLQPASLHSSRGLEPPAFARTSTKLPLKGWGHSPPSRRAAAALVITALPLVLYGQLRLPAIPASAVEEAPSAAATSLVATGDPGGASPSVDQATARALAPRVYTWLPLAADNELRLQTQAAGQPADVASYRLLKRSLAPNFGMSYGIPQLDGYENLLSREQALLLAALGSERTAEDSRLSLSQLPIGDRREQFGGRWPLALAGGAGLVLSSEQFQPLTWPSAVRYRPGIVPAGQGLPPFNGFEIAHPLPRAYITIEWDTATSAEEALRALLSPAGRDQARPTIITDPQSILGGIGARPAGGGSAAPPAAAQFEARILEYHEQRVEIETIADREAMLVLLDAYAPGWTATVTGAPAPILHANVAFRAVPVPAGRQRVVFTYTPPHWRPAVATTLAATVLVGLWLTWTLMAPMALGRRTTR